MTRLSADELTGAVMHGYFEKVDRKELADVLAGFSPGATLTVQTDSVTFEGRDTGIKEMFGGFFEAYASVSHNGIELVVDEGRQRVAAQFDAVRTTHDGKEETASNCNFFRFKDGKIDQVFIYMSDENPLG